MSDNSILPSDPERRRVIILHSAQQWRLLEQAAEPGSGASETERADVNKFLRAGPHVCFLCVEDALIDRSEIIANIRTQQLLNADTILMQDPFDPNRYERSEDFLFSGVLRKYLRMKEFFLLLGARSVSITHMTATDREGNLLFSNKLSASLPVAKGTELASASIDYKTKSVERMKNQLMLNASGIEIKEITDDPRKYLERYPFLNDFAFYERNRPTKGSFSLELRATEEMQGNLELACSLTIPAKLLKANLDAKVTRLRQESNSYELKVKVQFGKSPAEDQESSEAKATKRKKAGA